MGFNVFYWPVPLAREYKFLLWSPGHWAALFDQEEGTKIQPALEFHNRSIWGYIYSIFLYEYKLQEF